MYISKYDMVLGTVACAVVIYVSYFILADMPRFIELIRLTLPGVIASMLLQVVLIAKSKPAR